MKKLTLIATIAGLVISQVNVHAQGGYVGLSGGYGLASGLQDVNMYAQNGTSNQTTTTTYVGGFPTGSTTTTSNTNTSQSFSCGSGATIGLYGGYMFNKTFGLELGLGDKFSSATTWSYTSTTDQANTGSGAPASSERTQTDNYTLTSGSSIQIVPAIRLQACEGKIHPYMVTGLILGLSPTATQEDNATFTMTGVAQQTQDQVITISGGMMMGFDGAVGVMYNVTDNIGVGLELFGNFMNWVPSKGVMTKLTINGGDSLTDSYMKNHGMTYETDYVASASTSTNSASPTPFNPNTPAQATYMHIPFSSYGFKVSVQYTFGSSK